MEPRVNVTTEFSYGTGNRAKYLPVREKFRAVCLSDCINTRLIVQAHDAETKRHCFLPHRLRFC
jgi:hypothetical protein